MTNNESVVGPDRKRLPQGGWELLESGLDSSDAESGAANRRNVVGAGVMRADGLMARSASSADESESAKLPTGALSEVEKRSLFTEMADEILDRDYNAGDMKKYPYGLQVGYAAEMLEVMCEGIERGKKIIATRGVRDVFDPKKSLTENARAAEETLTAQFMKDGLSEDESDGEWYPMSGGQSRIPDNLDVVVFANYLASVSEKEKHAGRMRKTIKNGMTEKEVDNFMSLCPMFRVSTDENGQKQMKYTLVKADKMREMMENHATQKEAAEKPSDNQYSEPENSQPAETANHEAEGSQEPLSHEEQAKLIERINDDVIYNPDRQAVRARNKDKYPHAFAVEMAVERLERAVIDGQYVGFLRGVHDPEKSIEDNVSEAVQKLTARFVEDGIGDRTDGRWYALEGRVPDGLEEAVVAERLSAYLCDPEKATEARRMVAEGISDDQEDEIMLKGKHLGFVYRHGKVRWSFMGEEKFQEGVKPFSLEERLDFTEWLQEDLQDKKDLGDESPDVRERKEKLAAALKYLKGEISAAMEPGYLSDEEKESLEAQFSKAAGRRVEITPELYLLTVLNRKVRNADEQDDYGMKVLARNIYREFGDENVGGADKVEYVYNQNIRLRKIAENGDVQELLKLVD